MRDPMIENIIRDIKRYPVRMTLGVSLACIGLWVFAILILTVGR